MVTLVVPLPGEKSAQIGWGAFTARCLRNRERIDD
jgi:hypothetical protein